MVVKVEVAMAIAQRMVELGRFLMHSARVLW
jgi:hypothetical protein